MAGGGDVGLAVKPSRARLPTILGAERRPARLYFSHAQLDEVPHRPGARDAPGLARRRRGCRSGDRRSRLSGNGSAQRAAGRSARAPGGADGERHSHRRRGLGPRVGGFFWRLAPAGAPAVQRHDDHEPGGAVRGGGPDRRLQQRPHRRGPHLLLDAGAHGPRRPGSRDPGGDAVRLDDPRGEVRQGAQDRARGDRQGPCASGPRGGPGATGLGGAGDALRAAGHRYLRVAGRDRARPSLGVLQAALRAGERPAVRGRGLRRRGDAGAGRADLRRAARRGRAAAGARPVRGSRKRHRGPSRKRGVLAGRQRDAARSRPLRAGRGGHGGHRLGARERERSSAARRAR